MGLMIGGRIEGFFKFLGVTGYVLDQYKLLINFM